MIRCLVPLSGGKDSQATLKLALERFHRDEILGLFCDTQFEHPKTYAHVAWMAQYYRVKIETICAGDVLEKSRKYKRFPGGGARHCTEELKIVPTKKFCKALAEKQGAGFEVYYGMRIQESADRAKRYRFKVSEELYAPHEVMPSKYPKYLAKLGVKFRMAVLEWSTQEVVAYVGWDNLNPLYHDDFDRVGCFPCMAAGDKHKEKAFNYDDFGQLQLIRVRQVADEIGKTIFTSKGGRERNGEAAPCAVCAM